MRTAQADKFNFPVVTEIIAATTSAAPPRTQRELVLASLPARP